MYSDFLSLEKKEKDEDADKKKQMQVAARKRQNAQDLWELNRMHTSGAVKVSDKDLRD